MNVLGQAITDGRRSCEIKGKKEERKKILVVLVNTQRDSDRWWVQMRVLQTWDNLPGRHDSVSGP